MSRKRKKRQSDDAPGEDSFLDVVANLVGILIILVMVIGAQAQDSWQKAASEEQAQKTREAQAAKAAVADPVPEKALKLETVDQEQIQQQAAKVEKRVRQVANIQTANLKLERRIKEEQLTTNLLVAERDAIQMTVLQMESAIKQLESQQSQQDQLRLAVQAEQTMLHETLRDLQSKIQFASTQQTSVQALEHRPTPISKTVFGDEIHFRLSAGRIAYVPMQELVMQVKGDIELRGRHLATGETIRSTVGPTDNFRMQYVLKASEVTIRQNDMAVRRKVASVENFVLLPTRTDLGENIQTALANGSEFSQRLSQSDPRSTTISIWVYPDSFNEYRQLKDFLTDHGFMTATWPLPFGQPISGSPNGFKSSAQ